MEKLPEHTHKLSCGINARNAFFSANERSKGEGEGKEEEGKGRGRARKRKEKIEEGKEKRAKRKGEGEKGNERRKGKLEVKLWQERKKSQIKRRSRESHHVVTGLNSNGPDTDTNTLRKFERFPAVKALVGYHLHTLK